jgi:hypothetical protein
VLAAAAAAQAAAAAAAASAYNNAPTPPGAGASSASSGCSAGSTIPGLFETISSSEAREMGLACSGLVYRPEAPAPGWRPAATSLVPSAHCAYAPLLAAARY